MQKRHILFLALGLTILTWVLDYIAIVFYLYWTTTWYDIIVHFVGTLAIGTLIILLLDIHHRSTKSFIKVLVLVMAIGVGWEVFEYIIKETFALEGYLMDASADLIMDALGAISAYFITTTSRSEESF